MASDLWGQMAKFNSYSFCRAHAASYGRIAWANAYMKAHYPLEFWVAALNNNDGLYPKWVYIEEAKRTNINVLLPCVNHSNEGFTIEGGAIRIGLGRIKGLSTRSRESIYANRPFIGLWDLIARTRVGFRELQGLIRAGAMDFVGQPRSQLLFELEKWFQAAKRFRGPSMLFCLPDPPAEGSPQSEQSEVHYRRDEWRFLGLSVGKHPVAYMRHTLTRNGFLTSAAIHQRIGEPVQLCGMLATARTTQVRRGRVKHSAADGMICFMTLSDEKGLFETTLLPEVYSCHKQILVENPSGLFWIKGTPESEHDALSVSVDRIGSVSPYKRIS